MTTPKPLRRDRSRRGSVFTLKLRRWLYGVAAALVPVATVYGLTTEAQNQALLALAGALLGVTGLALANPTAD